MNPLISEYRNGNYSVKLFQDGTKIRETNDNFWRPEFPENIDCKITNYCDNTSSGCMAHCHEKSNLSGSHGDLELGVNLFKSWQKGCELALGGGSTLSHPDLSFFLKELKKIGVVSNVTVNQFHLQTQSRLINYLRKDSLIYGVGISYIASLPIQLIKDIYHEDNVIHAIIGVHNFDEILSLFNNLKELGTVKILLLGYKQFGNGIGFYEKRSKDIDNRILNWYRNIHKLLSLKGLIISFDNLAIEQLNVRRFFDEDAWNTFYQGDDGSANLYVDLVKKEYAVSSRSKDRFKLTSEDTIKNVFNNITNECR